MTIRTLSLVACILLACAAAAEVPLEEEALVGVWKMTYEPEAANRARVLEPSSGFLIFLPGGKYLEFRVDCCGPHAFMREPRPYRIDGAKVIVSRERANGEPYESTLRYSAGEAVVFFDGVGAKPVTTSTLRVGKDLNYGYGKVYPQDGRFDSTNEVQR